MVPRSKLKKLYFLLGLLDFFGTKLIFLIRFFKKILKYFRSLKEQDKLLKNLIESSELNQMSMCEAIYEEHAQVILGIYF